jgi:hypothetical protein
VRTRVLQEVLSGTLQVRFQVYNYVAFMGNRPPESISVISGTGVIPTSGFWRPRRLRRPRPHRPRLPPSRRPRRLRRPRPHRPRLPRRRRRSPELTHVADLISLEYAKGGLSFPAGRTVDDDDLADLISSATAPMEDLVGPILPRVDLEEWHDGGATVITLDWSPVLDVTTVIECYAAGYTRTLSEQPLDAGSFDAYGYTVDKPFGVITRRVSGIAAQFVAGGRNVKIVYTAGRVELDDDGVAIDLAPNLRRATRRLVRWLWQTEKQGQRPSSSGPDAATETPSGYRIPLAVKDLCAGDLRLPGLG